MSTVKKFFGGHHNLVDPYNVTASRFDPISCSQSKHIRTFKYRIFIFTDLFHGYIDMASVLY